MLIASGSEVGAALQAQVRPTELGGTGTGGVYARHHGVRRQSASFREHELLLALPAAAEVEAAIPMSGAGTSAAAEP